MSKRLKVGTLVVVETTDIEHESGWQAGEDVVGARTLRCRFVGWVLADRKRTLILTPAVSPERKVFCSYRLPRGSVYAVEIIRKVGKA
jgi:hypothetical protein